MTVAWTCLAHLGDGVLVCTRTDPHEPHHGCIYESTSGVAHALKEEL